MHKDQDRKRATDQAAGTAAPAAEQRDTSQVVRHVPLQFGTETDDYAGGALPIKEGRRASESTTADRTPGQGRAITGDIESVGQRAVYVLARKQGDDTPVFDEMQIGEAVAVFTSREMAVLYLQVARWDDYRVEDLTPDQLGRWLHEARGEAIRAVLVDPNRRDQERGAGPQPHFSLENFRDYSGENAFREVMSRGKTIV